MGGTRTMAQGFNPTMADVHPSGGGLQYSESRRGRRQIFHAGPSLLYPRYYSYQPSLFEAQPPAALFQGILTHPLTPYLSKIKCCDG